MELGSAPDPLGATIALIPVDFLAQSICHTSQRVAEQGNALIISYSFTNYVPVDAWAKIIHFDNPNKISFKSIFSWIDKFYNIYSQRQLEMLSQKEWWNKLHTEINASQSSISEKYHRERLDKLSGLLLFTDGVPTDVICYALDNSVNIGNVKFPSITDESFIKFISTEFN